MSADAIVFDSNRLSVAIRVEGGLSDLIIRKLGWTLHVKKVWHQEARQREKQH